MQAKFQILSLDGGGIKGLFSAFLLHKLEEDHGVSIASRFDMIVGTSTGGIIALALGLGKTPEEIVRLYSNLGGRVFPGPSWWRWLRGWIAMRYPATPLEAELKECFQDRLLGHSRKMLVIPSYDLGHREVRVFKTAHDERLKRDHRVPAWQVAMATSAAPTFFPAHREIEERRLVDGGVWANNPVMVGIVEAVSMLKIPLDAIRVLSIGTTAEMKHHADRLDRGGRLQWAAPVADVIMDAQSNGATGQASLLLGKERFMRINPAVPKNLFALDKPKPEKLKALASHVSMHASPMFKNMFLDHEAPEFTPVNQL